MFRQLFGLLSLVIVSCLPVYAEPPPHDPMYDYPVVFEALTKVLNGLKKANPQLIQIALNNPDENANIAGLLECRVCLNVARRALFCLECYSLTLACRIGSKIRRFETPPHFASLCAIPQLANYSAKHARTRGGRQSHAQYPRRFHHGLGHSVADQLLDAPERWRSRLQHLEASL